MTQAEAFTWPKECQFHDSNHPMNDDPRRTTYPFDPKHLDVQDDEISLYDLIFAIFEDVDTTAMVLWEYDNTISSFARGDTGYFKEGTCGILFDTDQFPLNMAVENALLEKDGFVTALLEGHPSDGRRPFASLCAKNEDDLKKLIDEVKKTYPEDNFD